MMDETVTACANCRFWNGLQSSPLGNPATCRRRAPVIAGTTNKGYWPKTMATDWCGEFEPFTADDEDGEE